MKKTAFTLILSSISLLHGMDYTHLPKDPYSEKLFIQTVVSGSPEAIDYYIQEHKKTYLDVLKVCAQENNGTAVGFALSKIMPPKPVMPKQVFEHLKKQQFHEMQWLCHVIPTSAYLEHNCAPCCEGIVMLLCSPWIFCSDIFSHLTAPTISYETQKMHDEYQKKYVAYKQAKITCNELYEQALQQNHILFLKAFKDYKHKKLAPVENAFQEL